MTVKSEICAWADTNRGQRSFIEGERILNDEHINKYGKIIGK